MKKRRGARQSVLLTSELFELIPLAEHEPAPRGTRNKHRLRIGTKTRDLGFFDFVAHRDYRLPKQITVSRDADGWWASFNFGSLAEDWAPAADERPWWAQGVDPQFLRSPQELMYEFANLGEEALAAATLGIDRGVANPMTDSRGVFRAPGVVGKQGAIFCVFGRRKRTARLLRLWSRGTGRLRWQGRGFFRIISSTNLASPNPENDHGLSAISQNRRANRATATRFEESNRRREKTFDCRAPGGLGRLECLTSKARLWPIRRRSARAASGKVHCFYRSSRSLFDFLAQN